MYTREFKGCGHMKSPNKQNSQVRAKILEEFEQILNEFGYKKTTIQKIADACGISKGHITFYFKKKEDLLPALFENFFARVSIIMDKMKLEENPMVLFFIRQLFVFYILEKKEDYYRKVSELSESTRHLEYRIERFYNNVSSIMKEMDIKFDSRLLKDTCVSLSYSIYGLINYWYQNSYKIDHIYFFDFLSNGFLAQGNLKNLKQYKEKALKIFESQDKEQLLKMYNTLSEYDYAN